jgi:RNA-directed DNA polymerase
VWKFRGGGLHKSENLFEKIVSLENLLLSWQEFRRGKRSKRDVQEFEMFLEDNLLKLHRDLAKGQWRPAPYKPFYVTDPKLRRIHKACVRDRVVHQAVFRVLYPIFDKAFIFDSYSCRVGKGTHRAVRRLGTFCRSLSKNYRHSVFALKCDIRKFFDSVDQEILTKLIASKISDPQTLKLTGSILDSFSAASGKGLPLGNVTSQLFANIYMNEFDRFVKHRLKVRYYIRYTDDFVILDRDRAYLQNLLPSVVDFLRNSLKLELHPSKIIFKKLSQGIDFLGYVVLPHHVVLRTKTNRRIFKKLSEKAQKLAQGLVSQKNFYQSKQSYLGILKHCSGHRVATQIKNLPTYLSG